MMMQFCVWNIDIAFSLLGDFIQSAWDCGIIPIRVSFENVEKVKTQLSFIGSINIDENFFMQSNEPWQLYGDDDFKICSSQFKFTF